MYTRSLLCAKHAAAPLLPHLLEALRDIFSTHHHAACLDTLATAVEVFSTGGSAGASAMQTVAPGAAGAVSHVADPAVAEALSGVLLSVSQAAHACLAGLWCKLSSFERLTHGMRKASGFNYSVKD